MKIWNFFFGILGELGDYDSDEHRQGYLEDFRFVPFQNSDFENEVEQYHKQHRWENGKDQQHFFFWKV